MPIPKSSTAAGRRVGRQSAVNLFTDRDHERELLQNFFERLARVDRERDVLLRRLPRESLMSQRRVMRRAVYFSCWRKACFCCGIEPEEAC
jgi:hypothetical protein